MNPSKAIECMLPSVVLLALGCGAKELGSGIENAGGSIERTGENIKESTKNLADGMRGFDPARLGALLEQNEELRNQLAEIQRTTAAILGPALDFGLNDIIFDYKFRGASRLQVWLDGDRSRMILDVLLQDSFAVQDSCDAGIHHEVMVEHFSQQEHGSFNTLMNKPGHRNGADTATITKAFQAGVRNVCKQNVQAALASSLGHVAVPSSPPPTLNTSLWDSGQHIVHVRVTPTALDSSGAWQFSASLVATRSGTTPATLASFDRDQSSKGFQVNASLPDVTLKLRVQ